MKKKLKELRKKYDIETIDDFMENADRIGRYLCNIFQNVWPGPNLYAEKGERTVF